MYGAAFDPRKRVLTLEQGVRVGGAKAPRTAAECTGRAYHGLPRARSRRRPIKIQTFQLRARAQPSSAFE
jgi:hypothetical protein